MIELVLTTEQEHRLQDWRFEKPRKRHYITEFASLGQGRHKVKRTDMLDIYEQWVREIDPEIYLHVGGPLTSVDEAPIREGYDAWTSGYRTLGDDLLTARDHCTVEQMIAKADGWWRDLLLGLRVDENRIAIPVGMEEIAVYAIMVSDSRQIVHAATPIVDVYTLNATVAWTNPGTAYRFGGITLVGQGGNGGGGAKVTTAANDAAGGGGGGGGGYIGRAVNLSTLSNGNVVIANLQTGAGSQGTANTNGNTATNSGSATTFAGLSAGGGTKGTGGGQGSGAQTGALGAGGTGDVAGGNGGTGRSGSTIGDDGASQTGGPGGAGGGGGGGSTADTAESSGGAGGKGWYNSGLHGTVGGGTAGVTHGSGGAASVATGEGAGGGAGSDTSNVSAGSGGSGNTTSFPYFGSGGGGGAGRARNAATNTGNGGAGGQGGIGYAAIVAL